MEPLTQTQQKILGFIQDRLAGHESPSQREIALHFGVTQNAVRQVIGYLKAKGYLIDTGGHRGLQLSEEYGRQGSRGLPIVGRVAAGRPILATEHIQGHLCLEAWVSRSPGAFLLKVAGDSMVEAGILDGDLVLVDPCEEIENGRIGVVSVADEVTVKRIYRTRDEIVLEPANARYETVQLNLADHEVRIVGRVVGCIRTQVP